MVFSVQIHCVHLRRKSSTLRVQLLSCCIVGKTTNTLLTYSSEWLLLNVKWAIFSFNTPLWDCDDVFVPDQHAYLICIVQGNWDTSPQVTHVAPVGRVIRIHSQQVSVLSPECCVLSGEVTNTNFIVFGLTRSVPELTIYRTRASTLTITPPMRF